MVKKIFLSVVLILVVAAAAFAGVVALQPADYRITRTAKIAAPPAAVFAHVNDFHNWDAWSPWAKLDPDSKVTFDGPSAGTGAVMAWSGNDKVGEGKMTVLESRPGELVRIKLDFVRPFEDTCTTEFAFAPDGDQTAVTWAMFGQHNFMSKAMCLFMDMDTMVGGDFEKGLASIKSVAEATK